MNDHIIDVLLVDDSAPMAQAAAQLVEKATGLKVAYTTDPDRALEIVRSNTVKVLVLDQRMPAVSGTELYKRVRSIDSAARAIMLTGAATQAEIVEAMKLGFDSYLDKSQIGDLAQQVLMYYAAYLQECRGGHV